MHHAEILNFLDSREALGVLCPKDTPDSINECTVDVFHHVVEPANRQTTPLYITRDLRGGVATASASSLLHGLFAPVVMKKKIYSEYHTCRESFEREEECGVIRADNTSSIARALYSLGLFAPPADRIRELVGEILARHGGSSPEVEDLRAFLDLDDFLMLCSEEFRREDARNCSDRFREALEFYDPEKIGTILVEDLRHVLLFKSEDSTLFLTEPEVDEMIRELPTQVEESKTDNKSSGPYAEYGELIETCHLLCDVP